MAAIDAYVKGFTAAYSLLLAALLLAGLRRKPAPRFLGFFLLLIALNQAAEAARSASTDPFAQASWYRVASVAAALDPVALYWFAATYPEPNALARTRRSLPVLAAGGGLALYAGWALELVPGPEDVASVAFPPVLSLFTLATYLGVFVWSIDRLRRDPDQDGWRFLVPALGVAALPLAGDRVVGDVEGAMGFVIDRSIGVFASILTELRFFVVMAIVIVALLLWVRRERDAVRRVVQRSIYAPVVIVLVSRALVFDESHSGEYGPLILLPGVSVHHAATAVRWLIFGAFASMAVFRGQALGWSLHARRRAARLFLGALFLLVAGVAILALRGAVAFTLADAALLLVAFALSQGFGKVVDEVALRLYGVPKPGDADTARAVYRRAAAEALSQGREPARDAQLQRLREELSLDAETAALLERLAEQELPGPLAPGRLVEGRYAVRRLLGRGSAGRAFLARDVLLERDVVLKEVLEAGDDEGEPALREARAAGALHHPNIVTVHDVLRRAGATYLVTEFVEGGSLAERDPAPAAEALPALLAFVDGLAAAHAKGVVHRDVKPQNVLVAVDGTWKLADFGIASRPGTASAADALAGTPAFMAPEQRRGERATPASDVYALGLLVRRVVRAPLPPALEAVVERATRERPEERFADAAEMAAALRAISA